MHATALLFAVAAPLALAATFTSFAVRSGSPIQYAALDARDYGIYVGGNTASYCPSADVPDCPPGNVTAFVVAGGGAGMDVEVPGGQNLYIRKNGALGYTPAHSESIPDGAYSKGFVYTPASSEGGLSFWSFSLHGKAAGFLACPVKGKEDSYLVFADVPGFERKDCLGFEAQAGNYTGIAAWQYE